MGRKICDEKIVSKREQKMVLFGAFIGCIIVAVNVYTVVKPYSIPLPVLDQSTSKISGSRSYYVESSIVRILSNFKTDVYELKGDVRIHGVSSTIFIASSNGQNSSSWDIMPHPRKENFGALNGVKNFKVITRARDKIPRCDRRHNNIPAILFSTGGLAGNNYFHSFTDVLVPLFLTSHRFNRSTIFLMSNYTSSWTSKYRFIIDKLSKHDVHDIDTENEVLCFSRVILGLEAYEDLEMKSALRRDFLQLLQLKVEPMHEYRRDHQPRMLIISRKETRKLMNEEEIEKMAKTLGFDVVMTEMSTNVSFNARFVNSFDVLVGVHGAGLTNMVFLRENAVVVQIIPFALYYLAWDCFISGMESNRLKSLNYTVSLNESSLLGKYPPNSTVYNYPHKIMHESFDYFSTVYLQNQDVNLDLGRFRETLLKALVLLRST